MDSNPIVWSWGWVRRVYPPIVYFYSEPAGSDFTYSTTKRQSGQENEKAGQSTGGLGSRKRFNLWAFGIKISMHGSLYKNRSVNIRKKNATVLWLGKTSRVYGVWKCFKAEANIQRKSPKRVKVNILSSFGLEAMTVLRGYIQTSLVYLRTSVSQAELPSYKNKTGF